MRNRLTYYMALVDAAAGLATCDRGRSGAIVVVKGHVVATGYVGSPPGMPHCDDVGHEFEYRFQEIQNPDLNDLTILQTAVIKDHVEKHGPCFFVPEHLVSKHCVRTTHAEMNAIVSAARLGIVIEGGTLYCTMTPCRVCAGLIAGARIAHVVARYHYAPGFEATAQIFEVNKISLTTLEGEAPHRRTS